MQLSDKLRGIMAVALDTRKGRAKIREWEQAFLTKHLNNAVEAMSHDFDRGAPEEIQKALAEVELKIPGTTERSHLFTLACGAAKRLAQEDAVTFFSLLDLLDDMSEEANANLDTHAKRIADSRKADA